MRNQPNHGEPAGAAAPAKGAAAASKYLYFPAHYEGRIKTLLLDANVTGHLDTIARKGSHKDVWVRTRMADMVGRLDDDVTVMPGLGAAESVIRRGTELKDPANYHRRSANATRLLVDGRTALRAWLNDDDAQLDLSSIDSDEYESGILDGDFQIVRDDFIIPSYAMVLKAYQLYLEHQTPTVSSFSELEDFAGELFCRGSREVMLGALLLAGNPKGREMALNIMKLREEKGLEDTLKALWNTSFDLTYSRVVTMPSLPELRSVVAQPAVFVTDDKHLGNLLKMIEPVGAIAHKRGGGMTADFVTLDPFVCKDLLGDVADIVNRSGEKAQGDSTDIQLLQRIRRYKSRKYVEHLEDWFAHRYPV
jgi:hypothetical protein